MFKVTPSKCGHFEQREIFWLEKLIQISDVRTITNCDMHKSNSGFCTSLNTSGEINFRSKLRLKTTSTYQIFLFGNCCLGKKRRSKVVWTFTKFLEWGAETFSDWSKAQTTCNMAVIETNQGVFMKKVWLFKVTPFFNVAPLDGSFYDSPITL